MITVFLIFITADPEIYLCNPMSTPYGVILTNNYCNNLYLLKNNRLEEIFTAPGCGRYYTISPDRKSIGIKWITEKGLQIPAVYDLEKKEINRLHEPVNCAGQVSFSNDGKIAFTIGNELIVQSPGQTKRYNLGVYVNLCPISPDGNFAVFNDDKDQLWMIDLFHSQKFCITDSKSGYCYPAWSPDSRFIAYSTLDGIIKVYDRASKNTYEIGKGQGFVWTQNSQSLLYYVTESDGHTLTGSDIFLSKYDGSETIQLTTTPDIFEMDPTTAGDNEVIFVTYQHNEIRQGRIINQKLENIKTLIKPDEPLKINYYNIRPDFGTRDSIDVPYVHQVYDTPDWHNGNWSCAPTTAIMAIAYYRKLPYWDCYCSSPYGHISHFGNYICSQYNYREVTYNLVAQDPSGNDAWGGYGYMWNNGYSPYSRMYQYLINHNLNSWVDDTPTWDETVAEVQAGWPYCMCVGLTSAGHLVLAVGQVLNWHTLIFNDPYGNKNTPNYPSYDGKYARYDWPGYNNGYQNLNSVYWCRGARGSWPAPVDTIVDDLQIRYPQESYGFYMFTNAPSTMRFFHDNLSGYNGHFWWTYTTVSADTCYVTWTPHLTAAGNYAVYAYIPSTNANANARYRIYYAGGNQTVTINQNNYSNQWVLLGTFPFNTSGGYVYLGDASGTASQKIAFDAMRWNLSTEITEDLSEIKWQTYKLEIFPNPFKNFTNIRFPTNPKSSVSVKIYNATGRLVKSFNQASSIVWNGDDDLGRNLPAGIYFIRLEMDNYRQVKKVMLLR
ncbi:MAG: golvesin C-terminal-like domain-containing protein [bacterium]